MKAVVLGAGGQLGQCFKALQQTTSQLEYEFYERSSMDISQKEDFRQLDPSSVDVLINCAAYTQVDKAESEREAAHRINVAGVQNLANYAARHGIPVVHFSTDYVFASAAGPIGESHPIQPINYYGQTKWEGEEVLRRSGVPHLIIRTSWLYSEYGHNFVKTMLRLSRDRSEISVVDDQTGSPTYARDLAAAVNDLLPAMLDSNTSPWGTYHFANGGSTTWYGFAKKILKDQSIQVMPIPTSSYPTPARRPVYSVLDSSLFEQTFGWKIPEWEDALERCLRELG